MIDKYIPIRIKSPNKKEHHFKQYQRNKKEQKLVALIMMPVISCIKPPVLITLIRVAPRHLDESDNLRMGFKAIKDCIAQLFFPDTKSGEADDKECFTWFYAQEKGAPKEYAIRIQIQNSPTIIQKYPCTF